MDIKIRNLSASTVKKIDELAKERGVSRNEYLKEQLEVISVIDLIVEKQKLVDESTSNVTDMLIESSNRLDRMEDNYVKMIHLLSLTTEIDLDVMDEIIEDTKKNFNWE